MNENRELIFSLEKIKTMLENNKKSHYVKHEEVSKKICDFIMLMLEGFSVEFALKSLKNEEFENENYND